MTVPTPPQERRSRGGAATRGRRVRDGAGEPAAWRVLKSAACERGCCCPSSSTTARATQQARARSGSSRQPCRPARPHMPVQLAACRVRRHKDLRPRRQRPRRPHGRPRQSRLGGPHIFARRTMAHADSLAAQRCGAGTPALQNDDNRGALISEDSSAVPRVVEAQRPATAVAAGLTVGSCRAVVGHESICSPSIGNQNPGHAGQVGR